MYSSVLPPVACDLYIMLDIRACGLPPVFTLNRLIHVIPRVVVVCLHYIPCVGITVWSAVVTPYTVYSHCHYLHRTVHHVHRQSAIQHTGGPSDLLCETPTNMCTYDC